MLVGCAFRHYQREQQIDMGVIRSVVVDGTFQCQQHADRGLAVGQPAMGYGKQQLKDLEITINKTDCDAVVVGTPIDLSRIINIKKPNTRAYYDLQEIGTPNLNEILSEFGKAHGLPIK